MKHSDTIVIGSGLAGLMAAYTSAGRGKKVTLLTTGSGSLSLNSGVIDVLGFDGNHEFVASPKEGIKSLPEDHPYRKIGMDMVEKAVDEFLAFTKEYGFPYRGSLDRQIMVPTAVGTMKPTCLAPRSLDGAAFEGKSRVVIVGISGLKDFYGEIIQENIRPLLGENLSYEVVMVDAGLEGGRDVTTLDAARWLDQDKGMAALVNALKPHASGNAVFLLPQILGTSGESVAIALREKLGAEVIETTCLPPSVNGLRLQRMFHQALMKLGVDIIEDTKVLRAVTKGSKCTAVVAQAAAREKTYEADKFILATGGFYSGGITMREFEKPREMIFDLPVWFVPGEENWSNEQLFSDKPQGFAKTGIRTDGNLRPVDDSGKVVFDNVYVVGRNLGGYDFCFEHSGNGVALASAYKAAMM